MFQCSHSSSHSPSFIVWPGVVVYHTWLGTQRPQRGPGRRSSPFADVMSSSSLKGLQPTVQSRSMLPSRALFRGYSKRERAAGPSRSRLAEHDATVLRRLPCFVLQPRPHYYDITPYLSVDDDAGLRSASLKDHSHRCSGDNVTVKRKRSVSMTGMASRRKAIRKTCS